MVLAAGALAGCEHNVLEPQGPIGQGEKVILLDSLAIMLAIIIPTIGAALAFAWWFREGNTKARYMPTWAYSGRVELLVWSIPILTILFLGGITWIGSHDLDPAKPLPHSVKPLEVQVVSLDWKWLFIYPDQEVASVNQLIIPTGSPVHFSITSASVLNTFFIPQLGGMIYSMNGMATQLNLQADQEGKYLGLSGHFSGDGFPGMHFEVRAVDGEGFSQWVQGVKEYGPGLDKTAYNELAKQTMNEAPHTYSSVDPDLFEAIIKQTVPPGPGPVEGRPTPDVMPRHEADNNVR